MARVGSRFVPAAALLAPAVPSPVAGPASLREVIERIPESCYRRSTARGLWLVGRDWVLHLGVLAALVAVDAWWAVLLLWVVAGFTNSALFVLGHDAAHEALFDSRRLNDLVGRVCFIPSLHLYSAWKLGHNHLHHRHTARENMDFVWHPVTPAQYAAMGRLRRLRHRVEWSALGAGVYYTTRIWWGKMVVLRAPNRFRGGIRKDRAFFNVLLPLSVLGAAAIGGLFDGHFVAAAWMVVKLIVGPFLAFCWSIGFTVYVHHIHPDMPWGTGRTWNKVDAQMRTTAVLRVRQPFALFLHSIFTHVPHHVDVRIPCYHLDEAQEAIEAAWPGLVRDEHLRMRDYVRTTRACKLFDFGSGRWFTYRGAREHLAATAAA